jgi:hypothetical protein
MLKLLVSEEYCLLECDAVESGKSSATFRSNLLPPSLGYKNKSNKQGKSSL